MEAAKHLKPCILELGGKAPSVVRNAPVIVYSHVDIWRAACRFSQTLTSSKPPGASYLADFFTLVSFVWQQSV